VLRHTLYPRMKGFIATVSALRDSHVTHVYDVTLGYLHVPTGAINDQSCIPSIYAIHVDDLSAEYKFHFHVRRYSLTELPATPEELEKWVRARWVEKDNLIEQWHAAWPCLDTGAALIPHSFTVV
jgi:lysocardiolipin and lysophospholipid acyltransferase